MRVEADPRQAELAALTHVGKGAGHRALLQGICHAFGSATTFDELTFSTARWVRAATGGSLAYVALTLPDSGGRLRVAWSEGGAIDEGRNRSVRRREAFRAKSAVRIQARPDRAWALLPLVSRGTAFGVLEIAGSRDAVTERWDVLEAIASQIAITLRNLSERRHLRRQIDALEAAAELGRDLARAEDPRTALHLAAQFAAERLELPVAAWMTTANSGRMTLTAVRGADRRMRGDLRRLMGVVPVWGFLPSPGRDAFVRRFGDVLGTRRVAIIEAGDGLLLVAEAHDAVRPALDAMASLLAGVLPNIAVTARAHQRNEQLDMGLAWTAHELRAPLIDVKAALEFLLQAKGESPTGHAMLRRSLVALEEFVQMTDSLLVWAVGARGLDLEWVDLVSVVQETVRTCEVVWGSGRVAVSAPTQVMARIDQFQLRRAIENVLRNALTCSAPDSTVRVSVTERDGRITMSVRDEGPGISEAEWEAIFDPLTRGSAYRPRSGGHGLGLFIAHRVIDAHGGRIWVESDRTGTTFHLQVPIDVEVALRSAS